jgi:hypothetical protein
MTEPQDQTGGPPPDLQRRYGILLIALGVVFVVLDLSVVALTGQLWVLLALVVAIPNFYRGIKALRESR